MKKPKFKLDGAAIKTFLVRHCEKLVLVVVLGVMAWFVYMGTTLPGLDDKQTPVALSGKSNETRSFIDEKERWTTVVSLERIPPMDLARKAEDSQIASDPSKYAIPIPWKPEDFPKLSPRKDPEIFPPQRLIAHSVIGSIYGQFKSKTEDDPLYPPLSEAEQEKLEAERAKAKAKAKAAAAKASRNQDPYGMGPDAAAGSRDSGGPGGGRGMPRRGAPGGVRGSGGGRGGPGEMMPGEGGMAGMAGPGGMRRGGGAPGGEYGEFGEYGGLGDSALGGVINPEQIDGFEGSPDGGIARNGQAIVLTAVVPFEKQVEEFFKSLSGSLDYDFNRDYPKYEGFWVWRAEVPADNLSADPSTLKWDRLNVRGALEEQFYYSETQPPKFGEWAGVMSEVSDPDYLDNFLTHPAPPFMQRDTWPLMTHPDVPLATMTDPSMYGEDGDALMPGAVSGAAPGAGQNDRPVDDRPTLPGQGFQGGGYDGGEGPGVGMPGGGRGRMQMPGGGMPGGGMPGRAGGRMMSSGMGRGGMGRGGMGPGGMAPGGMGSGGMRRGRMGGPGTMGGAGMVGGAGMASGDYGGYGSDSMTMAPPKYKLVRFTDTHVEPNKYYRYKIQVLAHDPNHPSLAHGYVPPTLASLAADVQTRVKKQDAADAKEVADGKAREGFQTFWRVSEQSEPSAVVSLPSPRRYFAGSVDQPATSVIFDKKPKLATTSQPKAKVLTAVWDATKVVDVPAEQEVYRGSILNFVKDAKVIHPIEHAVIDLKEYKFFTNAIVADLMGGEQIPPKERAKVEEALRAPGEILVIDEAGNLHVQHETEDIEEFRRYLVPEADAARVGAGAAAYGAPGAGEGNEYGATGSPDGGGVPGPGGRPTRGGMGPGGVRGRGGR